MAWNQYNGVYAACKERNRNANGGDKVPFVIDFICNFDLPTSPSCAFRLDTVNEVTQPPPTVDALFAICIPDDWCSGELASMNEDGR
jgi:hypothetical protein